MQLRPPEPPDQYLEEEDDDEPDMIYAGEILLARGKYEAAVRMADGSGVMHEKNGVVMIVSDPEDYPF